MVVRENRMGMQDLYDRRELAGGKAQKVRQNPVLYGAET